MGKNDTDRSKVRNKEQGDILNIKKGETRYVEKIGKIEKIIRNPNKILPKSRSILTRIDY